MTAMTFDDAAFDDKFAVAAELRTPRDEANVRSFLDPRVQIRAARPQRG